ncbi:MAG: class I SAM-dependent methyltransferase [Acidobacteriia bacterium]|nr:class I SAM-dependent methyltransferase [Terriglobia bacterium]
MSESATVLSLGTPAEFRLACPRCRQPFPCGVDLLRCPACELRFACDGGVWHLLPPERELALRRFVTEYREVRRHEGWGSRGPAYYRALPFRDLTGRFEKIWRIRAASFTTLIHQVLRPMETHRERPLAILDVGAGNGWLSHRLSERGHRLAAVDLSDDARDGLGAHVHYPTAFTKVLADFDHLPFADQQADLVVFNAALHYSPDCTATLAEALRVLRRGGRLVVMDTPFYRTAESGARMVHERQEAFLAAHGFPADACGGEGFLTYRRLAKLAAVLGVRFRLLHPSPFWSMAVASLVEQLAGRRETAVFPLVVGARP